jgi:hypothetical protein
MKKRFIVAVDSATAEQDEAFREYVRVNRLGWWHWLSHLWLLVDPTGSQTASRLTDVLLGIYPGVSTLVLELREDSPGVFSGHWSGYGPASEEGNMFAWIRRNFRLR